MTVMTLPVLNNGYTPQATFPRQAVLNKSEPLTQAQIDHATVIVHHRAPELLDMLGLTGTVIRRTA